MATSGGGQKKEDPMLVWVGIGVILFLYAMVAWMTKHDIISMIYVYIRTVEWLIPAGIGSFFRSVPILNSATLWIEKKCEPADGFPLKFICEHDFQSMQWSEISGSSMAMNGLLLLFLLIWCFVMFLKVTSKNPLLKFARVHNVKSFMKEKEAEYPHLNVFGHVNLIDKAIDDPVFGMSLTARQFMKLHNLVAEWRKDEFGFFHPVLDFHKTQDVFAQQLGGRWPVPEDAIEQLSIAQQALEQAKKSLADATKSEKKPAQDALQAAEGKVAAAKKVIETHLATLPVSELMLLACSIPRVAATDERSSQSYYEQAVSASEKMVNWCWKQFKYVPKEQALKDAASKKGKGSKLTAEEKEAAEMAWLYPVFDDNEETAPEEGKPTKGKSKSKKQEKPKTNKKQPLYDAVLDYIAASEVRKLIALNAYTRTLIFSLFEQSRRLGVFQPAEFRWLRFFDRPLWYIVDNIGRKAPFAEGGGVMAHWLFERAARKPIVKPQVWGAIDALQVAVESYKYTEEECQKYSEEQDAKASQEARGSQDHKEEPEEQPANAS